MRRIGSRSQDGGNPAPTGEVKEARSTRSPPASPLLLGKRSSLYLLEDSVQPRGLAPLAVDLVQSRSDIRLLVGLEEGLDGPLEDLTPGQSEPTGEALGRLEERIGDGNRRLHAGRVQPRLYQCQALPASPRASRGAPTTDQSVREAGLLRPG